MLLHWSGVHIVPVFSIFSYFWIYNLQLLGYSGGMPAYVSGSLQRMLAELCTCMFFASLFDIMLFQNR